VQAPGVQSPVVELDVVEDTSLGPLPQLASITVAAPPGQVTDSVLVVLSMLMVPTSVPEPFEIAMVIGAEEVPVALTPPIDIE
jgi:hypothetical protein